MDDYMRQAFEQAQTGFHEGNTPVGSVIVAQGSVIGAGRNRQRQNGDPTAHAELEAIRDAASKNAEHKLDLFSDAVCYTTMMPCAMCAGALIRFGFSKVVVGETTSYQASGSDALMSRQGMAVEIHEYDELIALVEQYKATLETPITLPGRPVLKL